MANIGFLILKIFEFLLIKVKSKQAISEIRKATHPDRIELVYSGEDYFSRLEQIIQNVQYEIHLQFYIFKMMPLDRTL
jgi:hypothetical protein